MGLSTMPSPVKFAAPARGSTCALQLPWLRRDLNLIQVHHIVYPADPPVAELLHKSCARALT